MKNSLTTRFIIIIVTVLLAALAVWKIPPKLGIDLQGGTSLLYELDLSKITSSGEDTSSTAQRVIEVLKKRVDPYGQKNMIWRVVGGKRIQIQMPLADKDTEAARKDSDRLWKELEITNLKSSEVQSAIAKKGAEREKAINDLAPAGSERNALLVKLAEAQEAMNVVTEKTKTFGFANIPPDLRTQKLEAENALEAAQKALRGHDVDMQLLRGLLTAADNPKNAKAQTDLADFVAKHPEQKAKIEAAVSAYKKYMDLSGGGVEDPEELKRLVTGAGVLDFRITVNPSELTPGALETAKQSLQNNGWQTPIDIEGIHAKWMQIDPNGEDSFIHGGYILSEWASQKYVLCYDDHDRTLTHADPRRLPWSVKAGSPQNDPMAGLSLPFSPDPVGANYMGELTGNNKGRQMAILLDDKAMTAPTIQGLITDRGQITFGEATASHPFETKLKEANNLKQIMDAGSLPAALQREPISVVQITPDMGEDNIKAGVRSALYALAAVLGFMLVYYTITGFFADVALMMNLLLVLAVMAAFRGTFTLPGIAGLVLTLGMAVDANVLINERIREEIHKGASLWMAIKQGYDRVFWTIFDANLTTSLTSIVLIEVGSEEVKGFGVTLLVGLIIHMFTALFVTRTFMMAGVRWGIIKAIDDHSITEYFREIFTFTWIRNGHFPFMKVITVTNIDWIGKRHYFWVVSAVITIAGLTAFVLRGEDKYDIEFRGGTQVTFQLKNPNPASQPGSATSQPSVESATTSLSLEKVRDRIKSLATQPGLADLESARIYGVGDPKERRFEMQTTIANTKENPAFVKEVLQRKLAEKFNDVLDVTPQVSFRGFNPGKEQGKEDLDEKQVAELMQRGMVLPVNQNSLKDVYDQKDIEGVPNLDVQNFKGGCAVLLDQISPPQTKDKLYTRILNTRLELRNIPNRRFEIVPLTVDAGEGANPRYVPAVENDTRPVVRAIMVSADERDNEHYMESVWMERIGSKEWLIARTSLGNESLFQGVTSFDAVVAAQAKQSALVAIILSLLLIVIYVWVRFGGIRFGLGAILSLAHDAIVALAATVLAKYAAETWLGTHLLISDFKINLTMIAAYLTIIGYSVNDTIVIFDRVRELRGRSHVPLSAKLVNDAINQCFGRTIWTTFTVFIVVLIMYIWGGEGVHGFSFAMLIGVITGAYSTLAIASPMLLTTGAATAGIGGGGPTAVVRRNPFLRPSLEEGEPTGT